VSRNKWVALYLLFGCVGCSNSTYPRETAAPNAGEVLSTSPLSGGALELVVHDTGGAAGDRVYRLISCARGARRCEILASIDSYDGPRPELSREGSAVALVVNRKDAVWEFNTYSNRLPSLGRGNLLLLYRPEGPTSSATAAKIGEREARSRAVSSSSKR
jgi:hypothetical protein